MIDLTSSLILLYPGKGVCEHYHLWMLYFENSFVMLRIIIFVPAFNGICLFGEINGDRSCISVRKQTRLKIVLLVTKEYCFVCLYWCSDPPTAMLLQCLPEHDG